MITAEWKGKTDQILLVLTIYKKETSKEDKVWNNKNKFDNLAEEHLDVINEVENNNNIKNWIKHMKQEPEFKIIDCQE